MLKLYLLVVNGSKLVCLSALEENCSEPPERAG